MSPAPTGTQSESPEAGFLSKLRANLYGASGRAEALLLLIGLLTWFPTIHSGDVAYDTSWLILENPLLRDGDPSVIPRLFTGLDRGTRLTLGAEYLPFRDLSVLADFALFGANLIGHHLQNLAWYLLSCQLFLQISTGLLGRTLRAFWVAAAFCLHPQHVESVAWLASRKDVLSLAFVNLGLLLALRHGTGWRSTLRGPLCLLIAMWAKNTGIVLPALAFLLVMIREPAARSFGGPAAFCALWSRGHGLPRAIHAHRAVDGHDGPTPFCWCSGCVLRGTPGDRRLPARFCLASPSLRPVCGTEPQRAALHPARLWHPSWRPAHPRPTLPA